MDSVEVSGREGAEATGAVSLMEKYLNEPGNDFTALKYGDVLEGSDHAGRS